VARAFGSWHHKRLLPQPAQYVTIAQLKKNIAYRRAN
jgi:hypothetical protein